jgi:cell division protease FtsH
MIVILCTGSACGRALGYTASAPTEDKFLVSRAEMMDQLAMLLGGRTAEELVFHEPTTGAANDIEKASSIARGMITEYGMSERLGARKFGTGDGEPFLGREMSHSRDYSEEIASAIDEEVRRLIESAHDEAWEILVQYREVLDNLVLQLMEHETLSRDQVLAVFSPIRERATRGSYTGYGKRLPSDRPPVLTPKEMALTAAPDGSEQPGSGNGQALGAGPDGPAQVLGPGGTGGPAGPMGPIRGIRPIGSTGPLDAGGPAGSGGYGSPLGPDDGAPGGSAGGPAPGGTR